MNTNLAPRKNLHGGTVLTVLVISGVMSVAAISYLLLVQHHRRLSARSQHWNLSISVAEAGIEEGLQHLNENYQALGRDGWYFDGVNYNRTRTLANGSSYSVKINASSDPAHPVIDSRGFVPASGLANNNQPAPFFATVGVSPNGETQPRTQINRAVRVRTHSSSLFLGSMVAKEGIDLKGNGIVSDSFDSADPGKSTNGHYDAAKAGDKGDVSSNLGIVGIVSVGNANVYGKLRTGPGGSAAIGANGKVGSHQWQLSNSGIQPGWATDDANYTFPDVRFPYSSAPEPLPGDILVVSGFSTNTTYVNGTTTYPGAPPLGSFMSPVTTNTSLLTTATYPGPRPGLATNSSFVTVTTFPGAMPGLVTNSLNFTTTASYPGAVYGLSTNSSSTTVAAYPGTQPGLTTNVQTTLTSSKTYPADGTYVGTVTTSVVTTGNPDGRGTWYDYNFITSSTYTYTVYSYTYPMALSYTYLAPTYTYPQLTYSYVIYQTTPTYTTNHYDHVLINGDYLASEITGTVYVQGKARLVLPNGLVMSGGDSFTLGPNGSIEIWSGGTSVTVSGNSIVNPSGFSGNFILYCADTVTEFVLNGNGEFTGVVVAPNADVTLNGAGSDPQDFIGCLMGKSVTMNGHFKFHYDEALGRMPMKGRFLITSWDEIR